MEPRKATVSVDYNGANADAEVVPSSFRYVDVASGTSDSISLTFSDPARKWIGPWFPVKGDRLQPVIKTVNWSGEGQSNQFSCGMFRVDDFSFSGGPPISMTLEGVALPADTGFKATQRTETYENVTLQEIGQTVAGRAGIALFYEADSISIELVEQNNQTDCDFYSKLVVQYGLALKVYNDKLVVFSEATYEAKGPKLTLTEADFDPGWSWDTELVDTYTGVNYEYTNSDKNRTYTVTAGGGDRILYVNEPSENLTEATTIALAAVNNANKGTTTMTITMMAKPGLIASDCVEIAGLGKLSGKYYIEKLTHDLGSGYKMTLDMRLVEARITDAVSIASTVS
jgi:hypothetical protein